MSAVTTPTFVAGTSQSIFDNVCRAMQDAEEIWGPETEDYPALMDAIIAECEARKTNCYLAHARSQGLIEVPAPTRRGSK